MNRKQFRKKLSFLPLIYVIISILVVGFLYIKDESTSNFKDGEVSAVFFDVGQGDSCYIRFPDGVNMLIDAGQDSVAVNKLINLGVEKLDYVVITHPHSDHAGGMADVLRVFPVGEIFMPDAVNTASFFEELIDIIDEKEINVTKAQKGEVIYSSNDLAAEILSPDEDGFSDLNDMSAVVRITYKDISYLFMGDAETPAEEKMIDSIDECEIIKIGHHGSLTSSSKAFLSKVNPKYAVISVGKFNDYNHPSKKVLDRLQMVGVETLRTDINGDIMIFTDGESVRYSCE